MLERAALMSLETYKIIHITGLALLFLGLGGMLLTPADKRPKLGYVLHGLGLLALLVAGFGLMARMGIMGPGNWPVWLWCKMCVWLLMALLPMLVKKAIVPPFLGWLVAAAAGGAAAWLALLKPWI